MSAALAANRVAAQRAQALLDSRLGVCKDSVRKPRTNGDLPPPPPLSAAKAEAMERAVAQRIAVVRERRLELALRYRKLQEDWKVKIRMGLNEQIKAEAAKEAARVAAEKAAKDTQGRRGLKPERTPSRTSSRLRSNMLTMGAVRSEYEEQQVLQQLAAQERLRTLVRLPPQLVTEQEKEASRFETRNGLIRDPIQEERDRKRTRPWTAREKKIFADKYLQFPKNFHKIATFLDNRTPGECVFFYYTHKRRRSRMALGLITWHAYGRRL